VRFHCACLPVRYHSVAHGWTYFWCVLRLMLAVFIMLIRCSTGPADLDPPNHASVSPALSTTPPTDGAPRASDAGPLDAGEAVPTGPHKMALKKWRHSAAALQASQRASPRLAAQDSRLLAPVPPAPLELSASPPVVEGNLSYAYGAASAPVVMEQPQEHAPSPVEKPTEVSSTQPQDAPTTVMSPGKRAAEGSPVGTAEHTPKKARKDSDEEPICMCIAFTHA
jgi:hypothetical protein